MFLLIVGFAIGCKKDDNEKSATYTTSKGGSLNVGDSIVGELGSSTSEVIYWVAPNGKALKFRCYDQSNLSSDTSFAQVKIVFAYKKNIINQSFGQGDFEEYLEPDESVFETNEMGIQDTIYVKIKSTGADVTNLSGRFALSVVSYELFSSSPDDLVINNSSYITAGLTQKSKDNTYYEKWFKATVVPGTKYYVMCQFREANAQDYLHVEFYEKDGITSHRGVLGADASSNTYYAYEVPQNQSTLYIRLFQTSQTSIEVKLSDNKPL